MFLFIGTMIPRDMIDWYTCHSRTTVPVSSDTHQRAIISGLKKGRDVFIINTIPAGVFPIRFDKMLIERRTYSDFGVSVRQITLPVLRIFPLIKNLFSECKEILDKKQVEGIFVYMPFVAYSAVIKKIKKAYKNVPIIVIVPDLVKHSYRKDGNFIIVFLKKLVRHYQNKIVKENLKDVDGFVYLTETMSEEFGVDRKYMVMEAIYEPIEIDADIPQKKGKKKLTYCGKISEENGVERLVRAFMKINNDNWQLDICGDGDLLPKIKEIARQDNRISFTGQLSHGEVLKKEFQSTVLVNPRFTYLENAAYSFPSKLIEYMACGKPVISSKLAGIPSDYDSYLIYIKDDTESSLMECIIYVMNLDDDELLGLGRANANFVKQNKSTSIQGKRMIDFIEGIRIES